MIDSVYIAWKYLTHNSARTATLVACITLIAVLPLSLELLLHESERQLLSRAESTPLALGAKGSALDLVMNTLYFDDEIPELITMTAADGLAQSGLALPIPMYVRFHARSFPVVGTTLDYFDFRGLEVAEGRPLAMLGECVIGAQVAEKLGLAPGDSLLSSPETVFDIAGVYPLKMKVAGVLKTTHTADDLAVFVDLKTAWVIEGLGHGHEDVTRTRDDSVVLSRSDDNVIANAKLLQYTEITEDNLAAFHFHGDRSQFALSSIILVPNDAKAGTILRGRYMDGATHQILQPEQVIDGLLQNIFQIKNVLDAVILVVGLATVLAVALVFALSLRLRAREISTIFKLGCSRSTVVRLVAAEVFIICVISAAFCTGFALLVDHYSGDLVRALFLS